MAKTPGLASIDDIPMSELQRWLDIGATCRQYKDDCLNQIKSQGLEKPNWKFKYEVVASDSSNKITKPASQQTRQDILKRLDWKKTVKELQSPYYGM